MCLCVQECGGHGAHLEVRGRHAKVSSRFLSYGSRIGLRCQAWPLGTFTYESSALPASKHCRACEKNFKKKKHQIILSLENQKLLGRLISSTWQNLESESPRGQISGHVCKGVSTLVNGSGMSDPKYRWHHSMGWGAGLKGRGLESFSIVHCLVQMQGDQLPQGPLIMTSPPWRTKLTRSSWAS